MRLHRVWLDKDEETYCHAQTLLSALLLPNTQYWRGAWNAIRTGRWEVQLQHWHVELLLPVSSYQAVACKTTGPYKKLKFARMFDLPPFCSLLHVVKQKIGEQEVRQMIFLHRNMSMNAWCMRLLYLFESECPQPEHKGDTCTERR